MTRTLTVSDLGRLGPGFGAAVGSVDLPTADDATVAAVGHALTDHKVLVSEGEPCADSPEKDLLP